MSSDIQEPLIFKNLRINGETLEELKDGASQIIKTLRPHWIKLGYNVFTNGITNKLIGVYDSAERGKEMILFRVFGPKTEAFIDRDYEFYVLKSLHSQGFSSQVYGRFQNGVVYGYTPGKTMDIQRIRDPYYFSLVAKHLAHFHKVKISEENIDSYIWKRMNDVLKVISNKVVYESLKEEIDNCQEYFYSHKTVNPSDISRLDVVFCHNDLLMDNILYDESIQSIKFIDFEYGFYNYRWYDIANHFTEFVGVSGSLDYEKYIPSRDFQKKWLKIYLQESGACISDDNLETAYRFVKEFMCLAHLFWGIWAYAQAEISTIDFNFQDYAHQRIEEYNKQKVLCF